MIIRSLVGPLEGVAASLRQRANSSPQSRRLPLFASTTAKSPTAEEVEGYVGVVYQALAVFRFFSFAMGAGLVFFLNPSDDLPVQGLLVGIVGVYNITRVLLRIYPPVDKVMMSWLALGSDVYFSFTLVVLTDGLDSAFLIYSLAPILTASLLLDARSAVVAAGVAGLSVAGLHVAGEVGIGTFPGILSGNYLAFALMYIVICLLIAYLPSLANLNWQRRVRSESMDAERDRLRREVHDNVAQTLAFLSLKVKRAEERASTASGGAITSRDVVEIGSMVERAYLAVRDYLDETRDTEMVEPLQTSVALAAGQWSRDTGLTVQVSLSESADRLPSRTKLQLLQITREALANVAKHANASSVWLEVEHDSAAVTLRIRDDGRGFSSSQPSGHGLDIMRERAALAGAELTVTSAPGEGTEVVVVCPSGTEENGA